MGLTLLGLLISGCTTPPAPATVSHREVVHETAEMKLLLARAQSRYDEGDYEGALRQCIELSALHPSWPALVALRLKTMEALLDLSGARIEAERPLNDRRMNLEAASRELIPDSYFQARKLEVPHVGHATTNAVRRALMSRISLNLQDANLPSILEALGQDTGINLITDSGLAEGKKISVEANDLPLGEFLEYLARNFSVEFFYGDSVIWASPKGEAAGPLSTRIFKLRHGIQHHGDGWGGPKDPKSQQSDIQSVSQKAAVLSKEKTNLEDIIARFVPATEGSELHFDRNTHTLIVRNSPANLSLIEDLLDSLDVSPPQIFIEARFVELMVADLREIGVDWMLDSPLVTTRKPLMVDGVVQRAPRTQVAPGNVVGFEPYSSDADGTFPLGPQGVFGLTGQGNPSTAAQGLNLTYQGILTEPMFQAVLHALEISGNSRTLSVPRVAAVNNTPAKMRQGDDLLYFDEFEAQAFNLVDELNRRFTVTALVPKGKPLMEELGITLVAVPSVGADLKTISLMLTPTISRLERFVSYQDERPEEDPLAQQIRQVVVKLPIISRREVQTKVVVESGETVVMGGLIDNVSQKTTRRIPFLSSLPGIGKLFQREDTTEQRRNLLIFVTATVISNRGESLVPLLPAASSSSGEHGPTRP